MRHFIITIMLIALTTIATHAEQLAINGRHAACDTLYGWWLCSVPASYYGTDYAATITYDQSTWQFITIDGSFVGNGGTYTFKDIEGGKHYQLNAVGNDGLLTTWSITFTSLPIVELTGDFGYTYALGNVTLSVPDSAGITSLDAKVKWRGNISNTEGKHKRNYHIKFLDQNGDKLNVRLFGLRKDNSWLLDAGQRDHLRIRNRVGHDLWLDIGTKPWYSHLEPNAIIGSRGTMVEVLLNGEYRGIYNMCEPVDRKQAKLVKYDSINHQFRGQLWKTTKWSRTATMSNPIEPDSTQDTWAESIEVKYPDFDEVNPTDWSTLRNAIMFMYENDKVDNRDTIWQHAWDYFDIPATIDYYIFIVTLMTVDNESRNLYYACYDKALDKRITIIPWDLDLSVGRRTPSLSADEISPERPINWVSNLLLVYMRIDDRFKRLVDKRYQALRTTVLSTDSLVARYRNAVSNLETCGAAAREERRWSGDSDIHGDTIDLSSEVDYIEQWLRRRMAYLDENVFTPLSTLTGDVNGDGEVTMADINTILSVIYDNTTDQEVVQRSDINGDGEVTIADIIYEIDLIFANNQDL